MRLGLLPVLVLVFVLVLPPDDAFVALLLAFGLKMCLDLKTQYW